MRTARASSSRPSSAIIAASASRTDIESEVSSLQSPVFSSAYSLEPRARAVSKPTVLVTRRLPARAMARLEEACDVQLYEGETLSRDALAEQVRGKQALV